MLKKFIASVFIFTAVFCIAEWGISIDEETLGLQAETAGKYREALNHYVKALQSVPGDSAKDQQLREKIILLAQKIRPAPAVPEEVERHLSRGRAAVKAAKDEQGYLRAANEFRQALKIAPWLADGYYNLGLVLDKGGKYTEAMQNLKLYLIVSPNAADAREVKQLIYEIEYRQEETVRANQLPDITGTWKRWLNGKWIATHDIRVTGRTIEIKYVKYDHPSIPPDSAFKVLVKDFSFDGKTFKAPQLELRMSPRAKNWQLTIIDRDLMIEEWLDEGGSTVTYWENGVMKKKISAPESYRVEWRRQR
jgi:tetratricopeptide (TPR) repeat protein